MKILFNNVDFNSRSGPNGFGLKLANQFCKVGHQLVDKDPDVILNFIQGNIKGFRNVLRLDGIYFNTDQDWKNQNRAIKASYDLADSIIVQSKFNKKLVTRFFGNHPRVEIIHNGTDTALVNDIKPLIYDDNKEKRWLTASTWRPHKRLADNIRYFQEFACVDSALYVAGSGDLSAVTECNDPRVKYVGDLNWQQLIALMKSCGNFLHLAFLDHCPNVVIDARASGCHIVCASSGGTMEIAGEKSTIIEDLNWDFEPLELYKPPVLDFSKKFELTSFSDISIENVADNYIKILKEALWD